MTFQLPEGFKPVTLQTILDAGWQAFIVEERAPAQALSVVGSRHELPYVCQYATVDGRRCAVGWVIPVGHPYELSRDDLYTVLEREYENLSVGNPDEVPPIFDRELIDGVARMWAKIAAAKRADDEEVMAAAENEVEEYKDHINNFQARLHDELVDKGRWKVTLEEMKAQYRRVAADYGLVVPEDKSKLKDVQPGDVLFDMHDYVGTLLDSGSRGFGTLQMVPGSMQHVYVPAASRIVQEIVSHAAETEYEYLNKTVVALGELSGDGDVQAIYAMDDRRFAIITLRRPVVDVDEQEH